MKQVSEKKIKYFTYNNKNATNLGTKNENLKLPVEDTFKVAEFVLKINIFKSPVGTRFIITSKQCSIKPLGKNIMGRLSNKLWEPQLVLNMLLMFAFAWMWQRLHF